MLKIDGLSRSNVTFKQNETNQNGGLYYKTHTGLKLGAALSVVAAARKAFAAKAMTRDTLKTLGETASDEMIKIAKTKTLWTIPVAVLVYTGCGILIDKLINGKRAEFAQNSASKDTKEAIKGDKTAEITRDGNVYQNSKIGKKYGALIGLAAYPIMKGVNGAIKGFGKPSALVVGAQMVIGAIGGAILGSWTDKAANKGAKKFADKADKK